MKEIDFVLLIKLSLLIAIETIGLVQWMKNLISKKSKNLGRTYTFLSLITVAGCCIINTDLVPELLSVIINLFLSSLAVSQLAWDVIVKAVPRAISSIFDKFTNIFPNKVDNSSVDESEGK